MNKEDLILETCELILEVGANNYPTEEQKSKAMILRDKIKEVLNPTMLKEPCCEMDVKCEESE